MLSVISGFCGLKSCNVLEKRVLMIRSCDILQGEENRTLGG